LGIPVTFSFLGIVQISIAMFLGTAIYHLAESIIDFVITELQKREASKVADSLTNKAYNLVGQDGNAFNLMGYTARTMKECGFSKAEIDSAMDQARLSDYNHHR